MLQLPHMLIMLKRDSLHGIEIRLTVWISHEVAEVRRLLHDRSTLPRLIPPVYFSDPGILTCVAGTN